MSLKQAFFLAITCCLLIGNMYAAQPIISDIGATIGIPVASSGVILTFAQVAYCAGVLFLVPLGDVFESRNLVLILLVGIVASLLMLSQITAKPFFLGAMFCLGLFSSAVQLIIPFSIGSMQESNRGKFISLIVAGAALGQVVGRPAATWLTVRSVGERCIAGGRSHLRSDHTVPTDDAPKRGVVR